MTPVIYFGRMNGYFALGYSLILCSYSRGEVHGTHNMKVDEYDFFNYRQFHVFILFGGSVDGFFGSMGIKNYRYKCYHIPFEDKISMRSGDVNFEVVAGIRI